MNKTLIVNLLQSLATCATRVQLIRSVDYCNSLNIHGTLSYSGEYHITTTKFNVVFDSEDVTEILLNVSDTTTPTIVIHLS